MLAPEVLYSAENFSSISNLPEEQRAALASKEQSEELMRDLLESKVLQQILKA